MMVGVNIAATSPESLCLSHADINECIEGADECDHNCHNSIGSYSCSCRDGYQLEANGHCKSKKILFWCKKAVFGMSTIPQCLKTHVLKEGINVPTTATSVATIPTHAAV